MCANYPFLTLDEVPLAGKTVFCRIDLNCPVDEKTRKPESSPRIAAHARTVLDLAQAGAKTVLLAHQGRKGDEDFIGLSAHVPLLQAQVDSLARMTQRSAPKIKFVDDVCGPKAIGAIRALGSGEVLLLQNVRQLEDETKFEKNGGKSELVDRLAPLCQVFVLDAFSCAHRAHASVVGFSAVPTIAGSVMEQELGALTQFDHPARPVLFVMGGAKPDDSLPILSAWLESGKMDYALTGGAMANLMLLASGRDIGEPSRKFLESKGVLESLEQARALYARHADRILLPTDVVVDRDGAAQALPVSVLPAPYPILDIGPQTAQLYASRLGTAGSIVMNGPMGVYEKAPFANGTRSVLEAIAASEGFSLLGGGHTISALGAFQIDRSKLGYVSLSGKALIEYLSGEKLPGVERLRQSAQSWRAEHAGDAAPLPAPSARRSESTSRPAHPRASKSKPRSPGPSHSRPATRSRPRPQKSAPRVRSPKKAKSAKKKSTAKKRA